MLFFKDINAFSFSDIFVNLVLFNYGTRKKGIFKKYRIFLEKLQIPTRSGRNRDMNFELDKTLNKW